MNPNEYVLIDGKDMFRGKYREFRKVRKVDTAQQAYRQEPTKGQSFSDLLKGNNRYHTVPARNVPASAHLSSSQVPLNWIRTPSPEVQNKLLEFDRRIAALEAEKKAYMDGVASSGIHMEWEFPTLDDFPFKRVEENGKWSTVHTPCGHVLHYDSSGKDNETTEIHTTKTCPLLEGDHEA